MAKAVIVNSKDVLTPVIGLGLYYYVKWHFCHLISQLPGTLMRTQMRKKLQQKGGGTYCLFSVEVGRTASQTTV